LERAPKVHNRKEYFLQILLLGKLDKYTRMDLDPYPKLYIKFNSKWIKYLNVGLETILEVWD
jgi:hypothetical protein